MILYHATTLENWEAIRDSLCLLPKSKSPGESPAVHLGSRAYCEGYADIFGDVLLSVTVPPEWVARGLNGRIPRGPRFRVSRPIPLSLVERCTKKEGE